MGMQPGANMTGWKWLNLDGEQACEECRSRHGQVYVVNPGPGENSIADLRRPPIHPNCRCALMEISVFRGGSEYAPRGDSSTPFPKWPWVKGGTWFLGLLWCNNNRDILDMPAYGKYGGRNWNAGRKPLDPDDPGAEDDTPVDDMDEAFARHDYNYTIMSEVEADRILVAELEALPKNTSEWRRPPTYPEYAEYYRWAATALFKARAESGNAFGLLSKDVYDYNLAFSLTESMIHYSK